jgi:beta-galactosidase
MKRFVSDIVAYVDPFLAKNGGPIILAQIENEYNGGDTAYVEWCGSLVSNDFASTKIPWIMCNGRSANSTIETCNGCNCFDNGWIDQHRHAHPDQPLLFTEDWGWFQPWGQALGIRTADDLSYAVAEWFAGGGAYHSYYMWHGGNHYGRTGGSGMVTWYSEDVVLRSDGTPNEPKYTHLRRLQQVIADRAQALLSQDSVRSPLPYWDGQHWTVGTQQYVYSYAPSIHFVINQYGGQLFVLFDNQNISMSGWSVQIYGDNHNLLWDSANVSGINVNNTALVLVVTGPLNWQFYSEPSKTNLPVIQAENPLEQLNLTNDETIYLWYRRNVSLTQPSSHSVVQAQTRRANSLLFFLGGQFLDKFDNSDHAQGTITATVSLNLSQFLPNQPYLFEILSVSLGIDNYNIGPGSFDYKGIMGSVSLDGQSLIGNWEHQKGLFGEARQIYTEQGSKSVEWNPQWTMAINKPVT